MGVCILKIKNGFEKKSVVLWQDVSYAFRCLILELESDIEIMALL